MGYLPFRFRGYPVVIFFFLSTITKVYSDHPVHIIDGEPVPPPPPPPPPAPVSPAFGYPGGFPLPGFGGGFSKKLEFNAGAGYPFPQFGAFPGAIGGPVPEGFGDYLGSLPPPPVGGLIGPSYIPQTWMGSALSAKGDLLFPIVMVVFFFVGVWTVVQFLLALIVPIIAKKFGVEAAGLSVLEHEHHRRGLSEEDKQRENMNNIMRAFTKSMKKFTDINCSKNMVCAMGNSAHETKESADEMLKHLNIAEIEGNDPKMLSIFQEAAKTGDVKCNELYPCKAATTH